MTDALNQTTTLERKPDGEVVRISQPECTGALRVRQGHPRD